MGKQAKAPPQPKEKGVKRKIKNEAPAVDASSEASEASSIVSMDRTKVSAMLGYLKYHADPAKERDGNMLSMCTKALEEYSNMSKGEKPKFLEKFQSGKMNLLSEYQEKVSHDNSTHEVVVQGDFFGSYILKEMGFDPSTMNDSTYLKYLNKVIEDSEKHYNYTVEIEMDEDFKLNKYKGFRFSGKSTHKCGTTESTSLSSSSDVTKALKDSKPTLNLKVENQHLVDLTTQVKILKSGKTLLEKKAIFMTDKLTNLKKMIAQVGEDKISFEIKQFDKIWPAAVDTISAQINAIRDLCFDAGQLNNDSPTIAINQMMTSVLEQIETTKGHEEAAKVVMAAMKKCTEF